MLGNILTDEVKEIFISDMTDTFELVSGYKFSFRYKRKRRSIIKEYSEKNKPEIEKIPYKVKFAVVCTMLLFALLIAGFVTYKYVSGFYVDEYSNYALLKVDETQENAVIEERIYFDMDLSGFSMEVIADQITYYCIRLMKDDMNVIISQYPISKFGKMRGDTEDNLIDVQSLELAEIDGITHQSKNTEYHLYNKTEKYIIVYHGIFNKKFIYDLVNSTKFK